MQKILIIEDNKEIRENISEILAIANYKVISANDGKKGVEAALREKPDLVICDIFMPELDGYGVLHLLQKQPGVRNIPFIFLTASGERSEMRKAMDLGADDFISKPFEESELLQAVESRLKKAEVLREELTDMLQAPDRFICATNERDILSKLAENRDINKYKKKQIIYNEGNRPTRLYYIRKGKVKTFKSNSNGKELVINLYKEGEFLGYVPLLDGTNYKETAQALEETELAIIPRAEFEEMITANWHAAKKLICLLAGNILEQEEHLLKIAYDSLRRKVADALLKVHRKFNSSINMSRETLAAIAGTATESLTRTLGEFKKENIIDIKDGEIRVLDEKKLIKLAE